MIRFMISLLCAAWLYPSVFAAPLRPHDKNPRYLEFRGKPTVLITAGEHYGAVMNQDFDYIASLDELARFRFNQTRLFSGTLSRSTGLVQHPGQYAGPCPAPLP